MVESSEIPSRADRRLLSRMPQPLSTARRIARPAQVRCPNSACRSIFTVVEAPESAATESDGPAEVADWRLGATARATRKRRSPAKPPRAEASHRKRTEKRDAYPVAQPAPPPTPRVERVAITEPPKRGLLWVAFLLLLVVGLVGGGGWLIVSRMTRSEDNLRASAEQDYRDSSFHAAAKKYEELGSKFGRSAHAAEYHFLAELANVRDIAGRSPPEPLAALEAESAFVQKFGRDPLLQTWRGDLASSIAATAGELVAQAQSAVESTAELDKVPEMMQQATTAVGLVERYPGGGADAAALTGKIDAVGATLAATRHRQSHVAQIVALLNPPKPDLDAARGLIRRFRLESDPAVMAALNEAERLARDVKFEILNQQAQTQCATRNVPQPIVGISRHFGKRRPPGDRARRRARIAVRARRPKRQAAMDRSGRTRRRRLAAKNSAARRGAGTGGFGGDRSAEPDRAGTANGHGALASTAQRAGSWPAGAGGQSPARADFRLDRLRV